MKTNFEVLYRRIGLLFYAAALEQKSLTIDDYDRLRTIIRKNFPTDDSIAVNHLPGELNKEVLRSVREAFRSSTSAKEAMQLFTIFFNVHHMSYDRLLKEKIVATYSDIVSQFSDHNEAALNKARELKAMLLDANSTLPKVLQL